MWWCQRLPDLVEMHDLPMKAGSGAATSVISMMLAGATGMLTDVFARNAGIRQGSVRNPPQARKRLTIDKPAGETVSKFIQHDCLL